MAQVYSIFVSFDDDSFAFVTLTAQICSGVCVVDADNTLKSEKNRQESDKRNSRVDHLVTYYKPQARFWFVLFCETKRNETKGNIWEREKKCLLT